MVSFAPPPLSPVEFGDGRKHEGHFCPEGTLLGKPDSATGSVSRPSRPWRSRWAEFQEHGVWWHGTTLYEEQVAVPLIAKYPAGSLMPARPGGVGRLLDVAPTILAAAGTNIPREWQGNDLALSIPSNRVAFAEEDHEGNIITAARSARFKLIRSNPGNPRGLPEVELFDLQKDTGEQADVAAERRAEVDDLDREIVAITTGAAADAVANDGEVQMDDATRDRLRALGYIE